MNSFHASILVLAFYLLLLFTFCLFPFFVLSAVATFWSLRAFEVKEE